MRLAWKNVFYMPDEEDELHFSTGLLTALTPSFLDVIAAATITSIIDIYVTDTVTDTMTADVITDMLPRRNMPVPDCTSQLASLLNIATSLVSSFCSCEAPGPTSTTTLTVTQDVLATTHPVAISYTSTTTPTPIYIVATQTDTTTATVSTSTSIVDITSTVTALATAIATLPPTVVADGLSWYYYSNDYNYGVADPGFDAQTFESPDYEDSGIMQDVNSFTTLDYPNGGSQCAFDILDCAQVTIVMQGYFYATQAGSYTFTTGNNIDNALYFWSGSVAYSGYSNDNSDYSAVRAGDDSADFYGGAVALDLDQYELLPVTIMWVNGGGVGAAFMTITTPDGAVHDSTDGFFVQADSNFSP